MNQKSGTRRVGKQSRQAAEKTKQKILTAALKIFAKEGFPEAKLRTIAAKAGTTHNLIRHHFGSKDDLWKAVVDYGLAMRESRLRGIIEAGQDMDPIELFKKTIESHILFVAKHADLAKILLHSNSRTSPHMNYIFEKQQRVHDWVEPVFKKAQERGYFNSFDHDGFSVYMRAIAETPIATFDMSNKLLGHDIRSETGIALHTQRVIAFLFRKDQ